MAIAKIFVGNIAWGITEDELREAFDSYGEISECKIVIDRNTGRSRGFGFITYTDMKGVKDAVEKMNGHVMKDRPLRVNQAEDNDKPRRREGGGGGGRY